MKLPDCEHAERYVGLYVLDLGDSSAVGYTAQEAAALLESETCAHAKVYKIHRAHPDGTLELNGLSPLRFQQESGMFFHCLTEQIAHDDYDTVNQWSQQHLPPCRCLLQLARTADDQYLLALIYPAEYEDEMGRWLDQSGYRGTGPVDAGVSQVQSYYRQSPSIVEQQQLWPEETIPARDLQTLLDSLDQPLQRAL